MWPGQELESGLELELDPSHGATALTRFTKRGQYGVTSLELTGQAVKKGQQSILCLTLFYELFGHSDFILLRLKRWKRWHLF